MALLARTFVEHCKDTDDVARLEAALPVVTALAFHIQTHYNALLTLMSEGDMEEEGEDEERSEIREDKMADTEFIISELLQLAISLDYADEIGRRKMFSVIRMSFPYSPIISFF